MSKPWSEKDDRFLFAYFDALGDFIGPHDLGRPVGAAKRRVAFLRNSGAWAALEDEAKATARYRGKSGRRHFDGFEV